MISQSIFFLAVFSTNCFLGAILGMLINIYVKMGKK